MPDYYVSPGSGKRLSVDVIIPALNEQDTIKPVIKTVRASNRIGKLIVVSDLSKDATSHLAREAGAIVVKGPGKGKGQAMMRGLQEVRSPRVIFMDADITGLTVRHVNALAEPAFGMIVGLRDMGRFNFMQAYAGLPTIAGERSLPTGFVRRLQLEGYGAEMQINAAVARQGLPVYHFIMKGVTGKLRKGPLRMLDVAPYMSRDLLDYGRLIKWLPSVA
jgi:glycosyltransferase involved in cell wall biosynthesis